MFAHSNHSTGQSTSQSAGQLRPTAIERPAVESWLQLLLERFEARAAGLWRMRGRTLVNLGHSFCEEMPAPVQSDFRLATAQIPLSRLGLGVVRAATLQETVVAVADASAARDPFQSPGWLARFEAACSFAIPIRRHQRVLGVLALALREMPADSDSFLAELQPMSSALVSTLSPTWAST